MEKIGDCCGKVGGFGKKLLGLKNPFARIMLKNRDRKQTLVQAVPIWFSISLSVLFVIFVGVIVLIVSLWRLNDIVVDDMSKIVNGTQIGSFFEGGAVKQYEVSQYNSYNEYISFMVNFRKISDAFAVTQRQVDFKITVEAKNKDTSKFENIAKDVVVSAELTCEEGMYECVPLQLYYLDTIEYYSYRFTVGMTQTFLPKPVFEDYLKITLRCAASGWLIFELVVSFVIWAVAILFVVFFFFYTWTFQTFINWKPEQWVLLCLNIAFVFYINPFAIVDDVIDNTFFTYFWKFVDAVFVSVFVAVLAVTFRVLICFLEKGSSKRKALFYGTNVALAGILFVLFIPIIVDYKYSRSIHSFFVGLVITLLVFVSFYYPLHLFRIFVLLRKKLLNLEILKKFIYLTVVSLTTVLAIVIITLAKGFGDELNKWGFMLIFVLIIGCTSISYLPSTKLHVDDIDSTYQESKSLIKSYTDSNTGIEEEEDEGVQEEEDALKTDL